MKSLTRFLLCIGTITFVLAVAGSTWIVVTLRDLLVEHLGENVGEAAIAAIVHRT